jgi:hypothetical protein
MILGLLSGLMLFGGSNISAYVPNEGIKETHRQNKNAPIWKLRFLF